MTQCLQESHGAEQSDCKKLQKSNVVKAMMDMLVKILDKETTTATATEKDAQADHEFFMNKSAEKWTKRSRHAGIQRPRGLTLR